MGCEDTARSFSINLVNQPLFCQIIRLHVIWARMLHGAQKRQRTTMQDGIRCRTT